MFNLLVTARGKIMSHDIKENAVKHKSAVIEGLVCLKKTLSQFFNDASGTVFVTNMKAVESEHDYCMMIDPSRLELIYGIGETKSKIRWDVSTGQVFKNGQLQPPRFMQAVLTRFNGVLSDLESNKAVMLQNNN
jgi:hypothetical protein